MMTATPVGFVISANAGAAATARATTMIKRTPAIPHDSHGDRSGIAFSMPLCTKKAASPKMAVAMNRTTRPSCCWRPQRQPFFVIPIRKGHDGESPIIFRTAECALPHHVARSVQPQYPGVSLARAFGFGVTRDRQAAVGKGRDRPGTIIPFGKGLADDRQIPITQGHDRVG